MALTAVWRQALASDGLVNEEDFINFKYKELKTVLKNMCSGLPGVPEQVDDGGNVVVPAVLAIAPIPGVQATPIPARCASCLLVASIAWN